MATTDMDYESTAVDRFEDDGPGYGRDQRSASPRRDDGHDSTRRRSASPTGNGERATKDDHGSKDDDGAVNPGSNLFVTGIHPRLTESEVSRLFEKYGEVEKCQIMRDPHTKESRGFGFVKMVTSDQADAAKDGLQGEQIEGRTLSIEKARRARPRTPTPGKYFGPPKREGGGRGGRFDRFEDRRRGGYGGGGGGRDDPYRYRGYDRRYEDRGGGGGGSGGSAGGGYDRGYERGSGYREDRGYDRGYERSGGYREDRGYRDDRGGADRRDRDDQYGRIDRYAGGREERDRYGPREDRRERGYERNADRDTTRGRDAPSAAGGYGDSATRGDYGGTS